MTTYRLFWVSDDCQADMHFGDYESLADAEAAVPAHRATMIEQATTDEDGDAGFFSVDVRDDTGALLESVTLRG